MPLNISIDVDGTLLDENEEVDPQARKLIEQLKVEGHNLQLWSTGGADYTLKIATERGLADLAANRSFRLSLYVSPVCLD